MDYLNFPREAVIVELLAALLIALLIIVLFSNSARKKEKQIKLNYFNLFNNMNEGFALHRIVCDDQGKPIDYVFLEVNKAFEKITGLKAKDIKGKCVSEVLPGTEKLWIETYGQVALTSQETTFTQYSKELNKHFQVSVYSPEPMEFATLFSDVTTQVEASEKIHAEKKLLVSILDDAMSGYWDHNLEKDIEFLSPSYKAMFGYDDFELENSPGTWKRLIDSEDLPIAMRIYKKHVESKGKTPYYHESRYRHRNGSTVWCISSGRVVEWDENNEPLRIVGCLIDITKLKNLENTLRAERNLFQTTIHSIVDGVVSINNTGQVQVINQAAENISGYKADEVIGKNITEILELIDEKSKERIICFLEDFFEPLQNTRDDLSLIVKSGKIIPIEYSVSQIINSKGKVDGAVMVFRDISEKKERQDKIAYLSYHDQLTGIYNRYFFEEQLKKLGVEENQPLTLAVLDVNGLKMTNDAFGHAVGDKLLKTVADVLVSQIRKQDFVFRIGGDEFVILMPKTTTLEAEVIFKKIYRTLEKVDFNRTIISVSIGWDTKISDSQKIEDIFTKAEEHMYRKKLAEGQSVRSKTVQVILNTLNDKNKRERVHAENVSKISRKIAEIMKFDPEVVKEIELAGMLHDIGKIDIDEKVLNKKGKLTEEEYAQIKRHPECGYHIMKSADEYTKLADYILAHHERWDGMGYPRGLVGEDIPVISRIINIADSYEAMTADRPYRKGMSHDDALNELKRCAGTQFDPEIVDIFRNHCLNEEW